jgi:hypothetical protein
MTVRVKTCIVPATIPGFFALEVLEEDNGALTVEKLPVVAWRISERVDDNDRDEISQPVARPICAREVHWFAVLEPDGSVTDGVWGDWPSVDAWLRDEAESRARGRAAYAAKQAARAAQAASPAQHTMSVNPFVPKNENNNTLLTIQRRGSGG